jgi:hypothetical protein
VGKKKQMISPTFLSVDDNDSKCHSMCEWEYTEQRSILIICTSRKEGREEKANDGLDDIVSS